MSASSKSYLVLIQSTNPLNAREGIQAAMVLASFGEIVQMALQPRAALSAYADPHLCKLLSSLALYEMPEALTLSADNLSDPCLQSANYRHVLSF